MIRIKDLTIAFFLVTCATLYSTAKNVGYSVLHLKCENLHNPLGIENENPSLSWEIQSTDRNLHQTAYQIVVSDQLNGFTAGNHIVWDSGRLNSKQTTNIPYQGRKLVSRSKLYWRVRTWDSEGNSSGWSDTATWEMGFLQGSEWQAKWIGTGEDLFPDSTGTSPAPWFRKVFVASKEIRSARIRVSGLGFYEMYMNGIRIGDQVLAPAQTNYDKRKLQKLIYYHDDQSRQRVLYNTYDVTSQLITGENVIGMVLGNGWYNQRDRTVEGCMWYNTPRLILQLELTFTDGTLQIILSDNSWKTITGPIRHDGIFSGEIYDARLELDGWSKKGYNDSHWRPVKEVNPPSGRLQSQLAPPDKVIRTISPVFLSKSNSGSAMFDCQEMISGWAQVKIHGNRGDTIQIRYLEEMGKDYNQIDKYVLKGAVEEIYEPRFTWHAFRQIGISGLKYQLKEDDILVKVVHSDVSQTGSFECSNPLFNQIFQNYIRTQLGNMHGSISSDCPHRERLGYTGDGQVAIETAVLSFDMMQFYRKWFGDMEDARNHITGYVPHTAPFGGGGGGPAWGSAFVIMPWIYYQHYGDKTVLQSHYQGMKHWVEYLGTRCDSSGIVVREEPKGWCLGDWATPKKIKLSPELVNTCYYYYVTDLMSQISKVLNYSSDSRVYVELANKIKRNINRKFFNQRDGEYINGEQGANIFPLAFGIVPQCEVSRVFANVLSHLAQTNYHFDTGILATPLLLKVLTENGRADLAYTVMNQKDFPSFGNYISGKQATTLWENWDGSGSHSHPMFGSVVAWFFNTLGGISPDPQDPGSSNFVVDPFTNNELTFVRASVQSIYGLLSVSWKREKDVLKMDVEIPANSSAKVCFPCLKPELVMENGLQIMKSPGIKYLGTEKGKVTFKVGSGNYHFVVL